MLSENRKSGSDEFIIFIEKPVDEVELAEEATRRA